MTADDFDPYYKWLGIPPAEQPPNHYRLLGLNLLESDPEVISNAADQRMVHLRAYQSGKNSALSQQLLNEIAAARVCLLTPDRKLSYDQTISAAPVAAATIDVPPPLAGVAPPPLPSPPPLAEQLAAAEVELHDRQHECRQLLQERSILRQQSWLSRLGIGHAIAVERLRATAKGFPAERAGLALVSVLTGLALGVLVVALFTMSGFLLLLGALTGAVVAAVAAAHLLFVPSDELLKRWEESQREAAANAPDRLRELAPRLADAQRRLAEAQQLRDRLAAEAARLQPPVNAAE